MLIYYFKVMLLISVFIGFNAPKLFAQAPLIVPAPKSIIAEQEQLIVRKQNGESVNFNVELAITPPQQAKGMMFRTEMDDDFGMLFVFNKEAPRSFWMKNTLISLDMIFIKQNGEVLNIHHQAIPQDLTPVKSKGNAYAVLEIKGGMAKKLGLAAGDKIMHRYFGMMKPNIVSPSITKLK